MKRVTPVSVKSKFIHQYVGLTYNRIEAGSNFLYDTWKVSMIIKDCFNNYSSHDLIVEPINDNISRHDLEILLLAVFKKKKDSSTENEVYSTFDLLSYDTLNKEYM